MASEDKLNIYQKLAKIRKSVEVLSKNASGYGYKYVSEDVILERITGLMDKYSLSLIPSVVPDTMGIKPYQYAETKLTKDGKPYDKNVNEVIVYAEMNYTWVDNTNPEQRIEVPWMFIGQQSDASQAFGSGLSYGNRYFLLKFFLTATVEDDPDKWRSRQKEAANAEELEIASAIVQQIRDFLNVFIAKHSDKEEDIKAIIKKHVIERGKPSINYIGIKDPKIASALLEDLKNNFDENAMEVKKE